MAIENEKSLVKFGYSVGADASTTAGFITFDSSRQAIYVGDGSAANLVTSSVKNVDFNSENKVLTIVKVDGSTQTLDFSDVASAGTVSSLLGNLRKDVDANKTAISTETAERKAQDKIFDTSIKALENAIGEGGSVSTQIENAINELDSSANSDNNFFKLEVVEENGKVTGVNFTNKDIASASALAGVKATADAAATKSEFDTHKNNEDIHITTQERTDWNNAKSAIDTFLKDASLTGDVIDTLTEIQDYIASDASAADKLVKDLSDVSTRAEKGISDASTAKAAADQAQGDVDALEGVVTTLSGNFDNHSKDTTIHITSAERTAWNAAEQNAKNYADGLAINYDKVGDASNAETAAKAYADAIKVNGQVQSEQNITVSGFNILVGGDNNTHKDVSLSAAIEDLYTKVQDASEAGVQSLAVNADSSNYAEVDKSTGAVSLKIKKVALDEATSTNTGVADAWDVKESIRVAKEGAISTVQGDEGDAPTAPTVAGAKAYADAQIEANALRWSVLS